MTNGRVFGIKKSLILKGSALLYFWGFLAYLFVSIFVLKNPELWFFGFCIFIGAYELCKSMLFRFDSSLYLGTLLSSIGTVGFIFHYTNTSNFAFFYISMAFMLASIITFLFSGQKFHLIIVFSLFFVTLYSLLYVKNLITSSILIAFLMPFLLLLILEIILLCFHKK